MSLPSEDAEDPECCPSSQLFPLEPATVQVSLSQAETEMVTLERRWLRLSLLDKETPKVVLVVGTVSFLMPLVFCFILALLKG